MDYFKIGKYQSKYENPIYLSNTIYNTVSKPLAIDQVIAHVCKILDLQLSPELERSIILSLCFMYSVGIIEMHDGNIVRS